MTRKRGGGPRPSRRKAANSKEEALSTAKPGTPAPHRTWWCTFILNHRNKLRPDHITYCGEPTAPDSDYCKRHQP